VYIKKLKITGMTNENGEFVLRDVPNGSYQVEITFVGYEVYRSIITVENHEAVVSADMKQMHSTLDETVVKGYYSTTNRLNTGNVTRIKGEDIQKQPVSDPIMALEGRVPGLYISQTSGMPGASYTVMLRGLNSIANGTNPLYIVDGVPFTSNTLTSPDIGGGAVGSAGSNLTSPNGLSPFNSLNPADIESIEVLKDADATAIYGSRGANGVILITTKKGKAGQEKIDINVYSGAGKVTRKLNLLNTQQYLAMRHQAFYNDSIENPSAGITPDPTYDYDLTGVWDSTRYTDWQKTMIGRAAHFTNAQASVSGGSNNTQFVLGGGYSRQTTVFPGNYSDQKASMHANINHVSTNQKFRTQFSALYVNDNNVLPASDLTGLITLGPNDPALYDANGNINWEGGTWTNPLSNTLKKAQSITNNLVANLNLGYEIVPGLQLKSSFGYTHIQMEQSNQTPASAYYGPPAPTKRINKFATTDVNTWIIEPQVNYTRKVSNGKLEALIGSTIQRNSLNSIGQAASGFLSDALISNIASASNITVYGNEFTQYRYNALFGRISYNWDDKYVLNMTARRDGSSRFGPGKQFGNFGAIGAAWIFSNEKFIQDAIPFLSFGKIRASYGTTGNDQINDYQYLSTYSSYTNSTYQNVLGLYPTQIANPYFGWELVKKIEGGIELGWLKDRIILGVSYYRNRTSNQLVGYALPSMDGFSSITANLPATIQNTGLELVLNSINIRSKRFNWSTSLNLSIPRNKLVAYPGLATSPYKYSYSIGKPLFIRSYYQYTGLDDQKGIYTFQDVNKDGSIDINDRQFLKQVTQNYFGGMLNSLSFNGWQLDIFLQFVKQTGINTWGSFGLPGTFDNNQPTYVLDRWQKSDDIAKYEKFSQGGGKAEKAFRNLTASDAVVGDASFVRLKNLALSYTLPKEWQHKAHLQNARLYIQCQNLFTITKYQGLDPETQGKALPPLRMVTAGIQMGL